MASCSAINLTLTPQQDVLSDCYGFKLVLSEGISEPSLAKLTLITNRAIATKKLKSILGLTAQIEIVQSQSASHDAANFDATKLHIATTSSQLASAQLASAQLATDLAKSSLQDSLSGALHEQLSCRYFTGRVVQASFVQKVARKVTQQQQVETITSFVYELHIASSLYYLSLNNHQKLIDNNSDTEALKKLLSSHFFDPDDSSDAQDSAQGNAQSSAQNQAKDHVLYDVDGLKHNYICTVQQETESDYALFMRLIYLSNLNYTFTYKPDVTYEQLNVVYGLNKVASPLLYQPSDHKECKVDTDFDLDQQGSCIFDLNYTCTGQVPPELEFLNTKDVLHTSLDTQDQQALLTDPFLRWLMPTNFGHNQKNFDFYNFCQHLCSVKLNQLQNESESITAQATNLAFQPGLSFNLSGLEEEPLKLMVRSATLNAVAPFPNDRAYPAAGCAEKTLELNLKLINTDTYEKVFGCLADASGVLQSEQAFNFARLLYASSRAQGGNALGGQSGMSTLGSLGGQAGQGFMVGSTGAMDGMGNGQSSYASSASSGHSQGSASFAATESACVPALIQPSRVQTTRFATATVCTDQGTFKDSQNKDWTGKVFLYANDNVSQPSLFWALLDDTKEMVLVEMGNSADAFPRVGMQIKLLITHGHCVYLSQFAQDQSYQRCFDDGERIGQLYSQHWTNYQPAKGSVNQSCVFEGSNSVSTRDSSKTTNSGMAEMGLDYVDTTADLIIYHYKRKTLDSLAMHQATSKNQAKMYYDYSLIKKELDPIYESLLSKQNKYEAEFSKYYETLISDPDNVDESKLQAYADDYVAQYNLFYCYIQRIADILMIKINHGLMISNMYADEGQVLLGSGKGDVALLAPNVNASASNQLHLSAKNIVLSADNKLTLAVGGNTISLTRSGIAIESRKWTGIPGMFDSTIYMDSLTGVSIGGMNASLCGSLKTTIKDGFGSAISLASGSIKTNSLKFSTSSALNMEIISNYVTQGYQFINEISNLAATAAGNHNATADKWQTGVYYALSDYNAVYDLISKISMEFAFHKETHSNRALQEIVSYYVEFIAQIITTLESLTEHIMLTFYSSKLNDLVNPAIPNYTVRDCIRTTSAFAQFTTSATTLLTTLATIMVGIPGAGISSQASLIMSPTALNLDSSNIKYFSEELTKANAPKVSQLFKEAKELKSVFQASLNVALGGLTTVATGVGTTVLNAQETKENNEAQKKSENEFNANKEALQSKVNSAEQAVQDSENEQDGSDGTTSGSGV